MSNEKSALLLVAHGSRDAAWSREVRALADRVRAIDTFPIVELAFLGLVRPAIPEGVEACVARGAKSIVVVPLFLFPATHVRRDIPAALERASRRHPHVTIRIATPFGVDDEVIAVLEERLASAAKALGIPSAEQGVVLVAGGSIDSEANTILGEVAARLRERSGRPCIQVAFWEHADPSLEEGVAQVVSAGARGVAVLPYLLFSGKILGSIRRRVRALDRSYPQASLRIGGHLGPHPMLAALVLRRAEQVLGMDRRAG
jgi:sirohydrochlorin ferrochelatase